VPCVQFEFPASANFLWKTKVKGNIGRLGRGLQVWRTGERIEAEMFVVDRYPPVKGDGPHKKWIQIHEILW